MAIALGDSTFRPLLTEDMMGAWELIQVHYDAPQTPGSLDLLPRGFLQLRNIEPGAARGFNRTVLFHDYDITGQFPYPEEGTLEEAKIERLNEIMAILTAGSTIYKDEWRYRFLGVDFDEGRLGDDETENYYTVKIGFGLEWITGI